MKMNKQLKTGINFKKLKFNELGLITAVIQARATKEVLMVAYMNEESLKKTIDTNETWFWSRSRQELWHKGATSGNRQKVKNIKYDCDGDALLIEVDQTGGACHTGEESCFFNELYNREGNLADNQQSLNQDYIIEVNKTEEKEAEGSKVEKIDDSMLEDVLQSLYNIIAIRKKEPKEGSYTNYLFERGLDKILKKVGEEATEVVIAAKNSKPQELVNEVCDLLYHILVLLNEKEVKINKILSELKNRRNSEFVR